MLLWSERLGLMVNGADDGGGGDECRGGRGVVESRFASIEKNQNQKSKNGAFSRKKKGFVRSWN